MMLYTPQKTRRAAPSHARRSWRRPLLLETLEDRVVPAIPNGTLLVATFPDPTATPPLPPAGIIGVDPSTGAQFPVSTGGLFSEPTYIAEDLNSGMLYVTDTTALGGAVIRVDPNNGAQTLLASGGLVTSANIIAFVNGFLYVGSMNISGTVHNLVRLDPNVPGGNPHFITSGAFTFGTGMVPVPDGSNAVYISDEQGSFNSPPPLGMIVRVNLDTGVPTTISSWFPGSLFDHPTDLTLEPSGNLIVSNVGDTSNNNTGSVFRVNPFTGGQSPVGSGVSFGTFSGINSVKVGAGGTIFVGHIPGNLPPVLTGGVIRVNPVTGAQSPLTSGPPLSSVEGMLFFQAVVVSRATTTTLTSSVNPSVFGQTVFFTATVSPVSGSGTPTGSVELFFNGISAGSLPLISGTAIFPTNTLPVGTFSVMAVYTSDSGSFLGSTGTLAGGQTVNKANTSTAIVSSSNPSLFGQTVTFTATVSVNAPGSTAVFSPTGMVIFKDGSTTIGTTTLSPAGTASFSTASLSVGTHIITATYNGDGNFLGSTSPTLIQMVSMGISTSTTTVASTPNPSVSGQAVTLTATVSGSGPNPTGTVTFTSGTLTLGTATLSPTVSGTSTATITTSILPTGSDTITASYGGDSTYSGSSGMTTQTVNKASTSTAIVSSSNPSLFGQTVTFTATVSVTPPGSAAAAGLTGSVTFLDGTTTLGTAPLSGGTASFSTSSLTVGSHTITASYSGDGNFLGSSSPTLTQVVSTSMSSSATTVVSAPNPSVSGQAVTLTATVTGSGPSPTGMVTFTSGTLALGTATLSPTVSGTSTATIMTSILPTGSDTITASYGGDSTYLMSSGTTTQMVNKASTSTVVVTSGSPSLFGQTVTFTATVSVTSPGTKAVASPTGMVTFLDGSTPLGTVTLSPAGTASLSTMTLTVGSHTITASYTGDGNFLSSSGTVTQQVNTIILSSTTTVVSTPSTSVSGQAVTLTATVSGTGPNPTGTVTFTSGTLALGMATLSPTVSGTSTATLTTSILPTGSSDTITASYGGDSTYQSSSGMTTQTVNKASTSTAIVSSSNPSLFGQTVTFTATVSVTPPGSTAAAGLTGSVTFLDGTTTLGTVTLSGGTASFSTSSLTVGSHTITASYSGDGNFLGSSSPTLTQVVNTSLISSTTTVVSAPNPSVFGQAVTFLATVTGNGPSPTGMVTFKSGSTTLGTATLSPTVTGTSTATITVSSLPTGSDTITASYGGDGTYQASMGTLTQTVGKANTSTTVASSVNPSVLGQPVTFTVTVSAVSPGAGTPTGTVLLVIDGGINGTFSAVLGTSGTATFPNQILPIGTHTVTASYLGDANFATSTGMLPGGQVVTVFSRTATTTTVSSSLNPSVVGQSVTFTATVSSVTPGAGTPTGMVSFLDGTTTLGTVTLSAAGTASFSTSTLTVGSHTITASYGGDSSFQGSSGMLTQVVSPSISSSTTTVVSAPNPSVSGQAVTLTATVSGSGPNPTGTVTFKTGSTTLGTAMLSPTVSGTSTASIATSILPTGSDTITASYGGDSNYQPSSGTVTQTVNQAGTSTALVSSANPSVLGQTVTFTATVSINAPGSTAAASPTGMVTFKDGSTTLGTAPLSGGTASFSTSSLTVGSHTITASYGGDSNFLGSTSPTLTQVVNVTSGAGNVTATLMLTGMLSGHLIITGDTGNNAVTIQQNSSSMFLVTGVSGTLVNSSSSPATFFGVTAIDVTMQNGNDSVTMSNINIMGNISLMAGSGSDTFMLGTVSANIITVSAAGPGADTVSLTTLSSAGAITVTTGDNANLSLSSVRCNDSVKLTAGKNATVSVNGLQTGADLNMTLGDNAQVTVKGSSSNNWNISQTGTGSPSFDLENDTINNNLKLNAGDGNNMLTLSQLHVANQLLIVLGSGKNKVTADHVTAFFGTIDGGPGGSNIYNDLGGNSGFKVIDFVGH